MEPTYTVIGSDGKQYGPITREQLSGWISEGRIIAESQIWRSDMPDWVTASALPELGVAAPTAAAIPAPAGAGPMRVPVPSGADPDLQRRVKSGASWFYWIAAFSIVNSVLIATGSDWSFALGLGATAILDHIGKAAAQLVTLALSALGIGLVGLFGFFSCKGHAWAFIVGMLLLAIDTVIAGFLQMWISLIIHLVALFSIFAAFRASRAMR
jgi:hypothetical protein